MVSPKGPGIILVEPQLAQNIGMVARAMGNFGLEDLHLVSPRDGWPNIHAQRAASGADAILDQALLHSEIEAALADFELVFATTARAHDQAKPVLSPEAAAGEMVQAIAAGQKVGVLFGRERWGLQNTEVALADRIITFPVNPSFASLNLAQAVLLVAYEWFKAATGGALPFSMPQRSAPVQKQQLYAFFDNLERQLDRVEFFRPPEKRETMTINLRNIFARTALSQQDVQTLQGVFMAIAEGRKGPAAGGVLDGAESGKLRALLAEHGLGRVPSERGPVRGLARLLRRNPTDMERDVWNTLVNDRRFAGKGFKRQVPIGNHIVDFVSFPLRMVIELVPGDETGTAAKGRSDRGAWLSARGYRIVTLREEAGAPLSWLDQLVRALDGGA